MLKIEIESYDTSALLHIGAALTAMGKDRLAEDCCTCKDTLAPMFASADMAAKGGLPAYGIPEKRTISKDPDSAPLTFSPTLPPPTSPVEVPSPVELPTSTPPLPAPPAEDNDKGWPDPPQPEQAANDHLDGEGIPWDARIHAGTKTRLKADNTWKLKPGIDKALVDQVKAELKGVQAVPVPAPPAAAVIPPAPTLADAAAVIPPAPTLADAAAVSAALQAPAGPTNFAELIKEVTGRITAGQMTPDQVNGAVALVTNGQLTMCNQLAARQDLIPAVWSVLCPTVA